MNHCKQISIGINGAKNCLAIIDVKNESAIYKKTLNSFDSIFTTTSMPNIVFLSNIAVALYGYSEKLTLHSRMLTFLDQSFQQQRTL